MHGRLSNFYCTCHNVGSLVFHLHAVGARPILTHFWLMKIFTHTRQNYLPILHSTDSCNKVYIQPCTVYIPRADTMYGRSQGQGRCHVQSTIPARPDRHHLQSQVQSIPGQTPFTVPGQMPCTVLCLRQPCSVSGQGQMVLRQ
jgi:hypothetical protein